MMNLSKKPEFDFWEEQFLDFIYLAAELRITRHPSLRNQRVNTKTKVLFGRKDNQHGYDEAFPSLQRVNKLHVAWRYKFAFGDIFEIYV
jgi:hypothetical protein